MARLTAPLLSLGASGTIAKALVYANWKGIPYARVHVIPANPRSDAQKEVRGVFSTLTEMWKRMPQGARAPFAFAVRGLPLTARNKHIQVNVKALIDEATLNELVMSVSGGNAIPPLTGVGVGDTGDIVVTCTVPDAPPNYGLSNSFGVAVLDGDPSPVLTRTTYHAATGADDWGFTIVVPADGTYQLGVFLLWTRISDGKAFFSSAIRSRVEVANN